MDYYGDDTWISSAVSFNPYQCELAPLQVCVVCSVCVVRVCVCVCVCVCVYVCVWCSV